MKRELTIFLTAVMFYTRIPCPKWVDHDPAYVTLATRYFPLIGWIVGSLYAIAVILLSWIFPLALSVVLALCLSMLLTGAFHEDGFADFCDGFGGGWTKEKILSIMKDSRVGTYGAAGLVLMLGVKVTATIAILTVFQNVIPVFLILVASHTLSRMMAVVVIRWQVYARDDSDAKAKPVATGIGNTSFIFASITAIVPLILLAMQVHILLITAIVPMLFMTGYLMRYFRKWVGGYTGDCLGAVQQLNEAVLLLSVLVIWKFT